MTTILGLQLPDRVEIYADSQITEGDGRKYIHGKMHKIAKRKGFLISGAGEAFPCDIAQHIWKPPLPEDDDYKNVYHFMIETVVPSLRKCLTDNGYNWNDESDDEYRFSFLIAFDGQLFSIADDLSVTMRYDGVYGVGSGSKYAIGAFMAGASPMAAMKIAAKNDAYTSAPFIKRTQYRG